MNMFSPATAEPALSNMALLMVLRRMNRGDLTTHGFRSTFRTWAAERTAFPREVVEAALAHVAGNKVEAAYQRGDMFDKRRRLMNVWAEFCSKITVCWRDCANSRHNPETSCASHRVPPRGNHIPSMRLERRAEKLVLRQPAAPISAGRTKQEVQCLIGKVI